MDELGNLASTPGGMFGLVASGIVGATLFLRKYWLGDKIEAANSEAHVKLVENLQGLLDRANARAEVAENRADELRENLYKALGEINTLKLEIGNLSNQIQQLNRQLTEGGTTHG